MEGTLRELEVVEKHIEELLGLQKEFTDKVRIMEAQKEDFSVLIQALEKEATFLKGVEKQAPLELAEVES